jgi:hypothetical protein
MVSVAEKKRRAEAGGRVTPQQGRRVLPALAQPSSLRDEADGPSAPADEAPRKALHPDLARLLTTTDHRGASEDETIALIEYYLDHPPSGSVQMTFTKKVSQYVIDRYNEGNRPIKPASIRSYGEDMQTQNWDLTGEPVKFSDARKFRDGQNRLYASIRTGCAFPTDVRFGISDASFSKMDRGKSRSSEDVLHIAGFHDTRTLSSAVRWVALYDQDKVKSRGGFKPDEVLTFVKGRYADLPNEIARARKIYDTTTQPRGMVTALLFLARRANPEKAKAFADAFELGNYAGPFTPLKHAIQRLEQIRVQTQGRVHELVRFAILIKAWNAYVEGKRTSKASMIWNIDEEFPKIQG